MAYWASYLSSINGNCQVPTSCFRFQKKYPTPSLSKHPVWGFIPWRLSPPPSLGPQPSKTSPVPKWNTGTLYITKLTDRNPFITIQRTVFLFLNNKYIHTNINELSEFPGSPVVKTPCFTAGGLGSILGRLGTKIPQAMRRSQTKKKKKEWNKRAL